VWHASIGCGGKRVAEWSPGMLERAHAILRVLMYGVGQGETKIDSEGYVLQHRRTLTEEEIAKLEPAWLALPAIDEA
jgi:hypothetical protein